MDRALEKKTKPVLRAIGYLATLDVENKKKAGTLSNIDMAIDFFQEVAPSILAVHFADFSDTLERLEKLKICRVTNVGFKRLGTRCNESSMLARVTKYEKRLSAAYKTILGCWNDTEIMEKLAQDKRIPRLVEINRQGLLVYAERVLTEKTPLPQKNRERVYADSIRYVQERAKTSTGGFWDETAKARAVLMAAVSLRLHAGSTVTHDENQQRTAIDTIIQLQNVRGATKATKKDKNIDIALKHFEEILENRTAPPRGMTKKQAEIVFERIKGLYHLNVSDVGFKVDRNGQVEIGLLMSSIQEKEKQLKNLYVQVFKAFEHPQRKKILTRDRDVMDILSYDTITCASSLLAQDGITPIQSVAQTSRSKIASFWKAARNIFTPQQKPEGPRRSWKSGLKKSQTPTIS